LEFSIRTLHGQQVDRMEVKALIDLTNKTMSRFPFRLPKNLALYMRMSSILEGIYLHHKVRFRFVKVLANILDEEGLLREAYIEETRDYFRRMAKSLETSISMGPMLRSYIETELHAKDMSDKRRWVTTASIIGSGLFIGSAVLVQYNLFIGVAGLVASAATFVTTIVMSRKK
jgi:predicted unusual protein kinase regulating ubiquinone biosynthesis (AarF/ABC1/UbiB family)